MSEPSSPLPSFKDISERPWWQLYIIGWVPIAVSYFIILGLFIRISGVDLITTWLSNIAIPFLMGFGVMWAILNIIHPWKPVIQLIIHSAGGIFFSLLWALGMFRIMQIMRGLKTGDWAFTEWQSPALAWQLFQGLAIYFIIVSASYAVWALRQLHATDPSVQDAPKARIYTKTDAGFVPLDRQDIYVAKTTDGLTFVITAKGQQASRLNLSELEETLPKDTFLRVHRSALINLDHILSIEPAGNGRLVVHLKGGVSVESSRTGAQKLKTRLAML